MDSENLAIRIKKIDKTYNSGQPDKEPICAISEISFDVLNEEFVSIVGPSGCGKSTLLNMVAGLLSPTSGEIEVYGSIVNAPYRDNGIVFQYPVLLEWRNIYDNIMLPLEILKLDKHEYKNEADDLLALTNLAEFKDRFPGELSGGMQQRACICRALIHDPRLVIMDEPFGSLDAMTREEMNVGLLKLWTEKKKTILFVTHSIPEAVYLSDRVVVLSQRPSIVDSIFEIPFERPRPIDLMYTEPFRAIQAEIRKKIGFGKSL
jgi:NitT/TauT family transport system ATP-binding protein